MAKFLTVPFHISTSGEVGYTRSSADAIKQYIACVLLTNIRERLMEPGYGSRLFTEVFENPNEVERSVARIIETSLVTWLPRVKVNSVKFVNNTVADGEATVTLVYTLEDGTVDSVTITRANIVGGL